MRIKVLPQALKVRPLLRVLLPALWRVLLTLLLQAQLLLLQALLTLQPVLLPLLLQARLLLLPVLPRVLPQAQLSLLPALPPLLILLLQGPALRRIPRHLPRSQQKPQEFRRIPAQKP